MNKKRQVTPPIDCDSTPRGGCVRCRYCETSNKITIPVPPHVPLSPLSKGEGQEFVCHACANNTRKHIRNYEL